MLVCDSVAEANVCTFACALSFTRCMMPAQYLCSGEHAQEEWHHYGLAAPIYTHFTSPIRRYADVCVHRLLGAAIGVAPLPAFLMDKVSTRLYLNCKLVRHVWTRYNTTLRLRHEVFAL